MKKLALLFLLIFIVVNFSLAQKPSIELTYTAVNNGQYIPLDSILIENLTQGGDTTLYAPDTVLVLDYITNIDNKETLEENTFSVSQNYPNPFKGKTEVNLNLPEKENITITVRDILGRELVHYKNTFNRGSHAFSFYPGNEKYYLLTVTGNQTSQTIKMLKIYNNTSSRGKCQIVYNGFDDYKNTYKSQQAINNFGFNPEDELQFTAYSITEIGNIGSDIKIDTPETNKTYEFNILGGLRCPGITTITDIDGNIYNTVQIGPQCWMKENLKTTTYQNGSPIPNVTIDSLWGPLTTGAYVWYNNDISWKDLYGAMYNWYTTVDSNGLCPSGWHVPTNDEWIDLTDYIGGTSPPHGNELKSCRQVNSPLSGVCNTSEHPRWDEHDTAFGTDDYGFAVLPGGRRDYYGDFNSLGTDGYWWSSTEAGSNTSWSRRIAFYVGPVVEWPNYRINGISVRCLRD